MKITKHLSMIVFLFCYLLQSSLFFYCYIFFNICSFFYIIFFKEHKYINQSFHNFILFNIYNLCNLESFFLFFHFSLFIFLLIVDLRIFLFFVFFHCSLNFLFTVILFQELYFVPLTDQTNHINLKRFNPFYGWFRSKSNLTSQILNLYFFFYEFNFFRSIFLEIQIYDLFILQLLFYKLWLSYSFYVSSLIVDNGELFKELLMLLLLCSFIYMIFQQYFKFDFPGYNNIQKMTVHLLHL